MYLESEKELLKKNYRGYHRTSENTIYISNKNQIDQISLEKTISNLEKKWKVSFPLKFSEINYAKYFYTEKQAKDYIKKVVTEYI